MFRDLIRFCRQIHISRRFRVRSIHMPSRENFNYTFDNIARVTERLP